MTRHGGRSAGAAAVAAIVAAPLALVGLVLGLSIVDFDAESFRDADTVLQLGSDAAAPLRASFLLVMLGSYLLLVPLATGLSRQLRRRDRATTDLATVAGVTYLLLGAAGACILAAVWPHLVEQHAEGVDHDMLVVAFGTATRIAEDGLQGALQNIAGAVWWLLLAPMFRGSGARALSALTVVLGLASALNAMGALLSVEQLTLVGLTGTVLLAPLWGVATGVWLLRGGGGTS